MIASLLENTVDGKSPLTVGELTPAFDAPPAVMDALAEVVEDEDYGAINANDEGQIWSGKEKLVVF